MWACNVQGFISYSHEDYQDCLRLLTHLKAMEREHGISFWWDRRIAAGDCWSEEIARAINRADIFVLLTSPDFIGSEYIWKTELPAIEGRRMAGAVVVPVVLRRCAWQMISGALQAVPTIEGRLKPIRAWKPVEDGYDQARTQIHSKAITHFGLSPNPLFRAR